jgi:hypothetical protein
MRIPTGSVGAVRQPGSPAARSVATRAWATPACLVGSRLPQSIIAPAGTNGRSAPTSPAYLHTCILRRPRHGCWGSLLARRLSPSAHKTCRISQTGLWRRPSVPTRQLPAAETLQSASSGWHTDARADRLPNRTLDVLARPRPPYTVHQTMYSPSAPP